MFEDPSSRFKPTAFQSVLLSDSDSAARMEGCLSIDEHAVFDIKYHISWIVKYRHKILHARVAERARDLIRQTFNARGVVIVRGAVSLDHIHMLVSAPPEGVVLETAAVNQGTSLPSCGSSSWDNIRGDEDTFARRWGGGCEDSSSKYIENEKWDEDGQGFKITAPTEP